MPLKRIKKDTAQELALEWVLHIKNYKLALDKNRCVGCQICSLACPKEAIKAEKQPKMTGEKARKAKIDVDLAKCNFCGICDILCPYGAVRVTLDGKHALPVVESESFPQLTRDINADPGKCPTDCSDCEEACPLNLIEVSWVKADGTTVDNPQILSDQEKAGLQAKIDVKKEYCPCCRVCEIKCPKGIMHVRKFLEGKILIDQKECPTGCRDCLDVCPIEGALFLSDRDGKVHANEAFCVYCGACRIVCPVDQALSVERTRFSHTNIRSGAWNKALERLTSPVEMTKELKTKGSAKARESVKKRAGLEKKTDAQRKSR